MPSFTERLDRELYLSLNAAMSAQDGHEFVACAVCGYENDANARKRCKSCGVDIPKSHVRILSEPYKGTTASISSEP